MWGARLDLVIFRLTKAASRATRYLAKICNIDTCSCDSEGGTSLCQAIRSIQIHVLPCVVATDHRGGSGGGGGEHHLVSTAVPVTAGHGGPQHELDEVQPEEADLLVDLDEVVGAGGGSHGGGGVLCVLYVGGVGSDLPPTPRQPDHAADPEPPGTHPVPQ